MAKKKTTSQIPESVRQWFSQIGKKGGATTGPTKARDSEKMRAAGKQAWKNKKGKKQL